MDGGVSSQNNVSGSRSLNLSQQEKDQVILSYLEKMADEHKSGAESAEDRAKDIMIFNQLVANLNRG